jgi:hypothetical protein
MDWASSTCRSKSVNFQISPPAPDPSERVRSDLPCLCNASGYFFHFAPHAAGQVSPQRPATTGNQHPNQQNWISTNTGHFHLPRLQPKTESCCMGISPHGLLHAAMPTSSAGAHNPCEICCPRICWHAGTCLLQRCPGSCSASPTCH